MSNELDEKFVADDGVSTVEDPVTPAGGTIKKKKADVKKSADPKADKVDKVTPGQGAVKEEADSEVVVEVVEIEESIASIFEGMDLSEEFTSKVTLVFEAAVHEAASIKANTIIAEKTEALEVEMKESVDSAVEKIVENLDSYLDYVVEEWMKENALAIEAGVKVEIAESLMTGLKSLFEEHNIEVNEETVDVVAGLEEEVATLKTTANDTINENVVLHKQIASLKADQAFSEMTEDLTITQRERLKVLSEKLDVQDIAEYKKDLRTLQESFFASKKVVVEEVSDEEQEIMTEETVVAKPASDYSSINALSEFLNSRK
tara:strand:+ start:1874 stop:2827 length:954 start_codon:yes stop_codon:yes gene_type:complete